MISIGCRSQRPTPNKNNENRYSKNLKEWIDE